MRGFNTSGRALQCAGHQKHHLIPLAVYKCRAFEPIFLQIKTLGFDPRDFATNGILLPCTDEMALSTGKPLHRGPHPQYSQLVRESIFVLTDPQTFPSNSAPRAIDLAKRICRLQSSLYRALSVTHPALTRVGHDMDAAFSTLAADYMALAKSTQLS
jgi:hypothetical protein